MIRGLLWACLRGMAAVLMCTGVCEPGPCLGAVPTAWQLLNDGDPSVGPAVATYDVARQRAVLVTPSSGASAAPVIHWELVGEDWARRFLPDPTPRIFVAGCMAFDTGRHVSVLFGAGAYGNETWEFDGSQWGQKHPAAVPAGRSQCGMAYDPGIQRTVMFGGYSTGTTGLGDTWEWDGTNWTAINPPGPPGFRGDFGMAFDAARGKVTMFGGRNDFVMYADTWQYDGKKKRWIQKTPATSPSGRAGAMAAFDVSRSVMVILGGYTSATFVNETWEWDGTTWTQRFPAHAPSLRADLLLMYEAARGRIVGWGGYVAANEWYNDTWAYNGVDWSRVAVSGLPPGRAEFSMAFDRTNRELLLFGGWTSFVPPPTSWTDTWVYSGGLWSQEPNAGIPSDLSGFPLAYDPANHGLRGFSGLGQNWIMNNADVHVYAGTPGQWDSTPSCCPDERNDHAWVSVTPGNTFYLFGGQACCYGGFDYYANDTWQFAATTGWTRLNPVHSPSTRMGMGMIWDPKRQHALLYGGSTSTSYSDEVADTWTYDGTDWALLQDPSPPGRRGWFGMTYDEARDVVVLFGNGAAGEGVTWEFDGTTWIAHATPFQPDSARAYIRTAYDSSNRVTMLFGGRDLLSELYFNDTWAYGPDPDGDGIVGGLDNCPNVANANQANVDGDPAGDVCDCAPTDPTAWAMPEPVTGLLAIGSGTTSLTWDDQSAAIGTGAQYDVATGLLSDLHGTGGLGPATCLASRVAVPSASDGRVPTVADGFYYLVRSRNACGIGSYGAAALDAASPCP